MGSATTKRKLAAILAADVVGYSGLMSDHEERTLRALNDALAIFQRLVPDYDGRIFGGAGDSVIVDFPSAVEALRCAVAIQMALAERNAKAPAGEQLQFRIGINVGDVIVEGDNLMGEGVNVAARLESLARPGGINISVGVYHQVRNKVPGTYEDIGSQQLKNIPEPVHIYRVTTEAAVMDIPVPHHESQRLARRHWAMIAAGLAMVVAVVTVSVVLFRGPMHPSAELFADDASSSEQALPRVAVLPFSNMSDDPAQEYFSDGMSEDLITDLTKLSNLFVIARDSSFFYKGNVQDVRQIARELGVRYVVHGTVRRAGNRVRINVQLVDAENGRQLWAERYDGELRDVFEVQDVITQRIVAVLTIKLTADERQHLARRETDNLEAYEYYLQAQERAARYTKAENRVAQSLYEKAIALDPKFATAYAALAWSHVFDAMNGWTDVREDSLTKSYATASRALELDSALPLGYFVTGLVYRERGDYVEALVEAEKAIALDPNYANGHVLVATLLYYAGRPEDGLARIKKAMQLNPHYPHNYPFHLGQAYFVLRRYEEAIDAFKQGLVANPTSERLRVWLAAAYAQSGRIDDAIWEMDLIREANPDISLAKISKAFPFKDPADLKHLLEGLRIAGLTE